MSGAVQSTAVDFVARNKERQARLFARIKEAYTDYFDGPWHPATRAMHKSLGASGFEVDRWWCLTSPHWECPVCLRGKSQIVRLTKNGQLCCRLALHHDHSTSDFLNVLDERDRVPGAGLLKHHQRLERFGRLLICQDCNNADAKAKMVVGASGGDLGFFSFSPEEIASFIYPGPPGRGHTIREDVAHGLWATLHPKHLTRMAALRTMAEAAGALERCGPPVRVGHMLDKDWDPWDSSQALLDVCRDLGVSRRDTDKVELVSLLRLGDEERLRPVKPISAPGKGASKSPAIALNEADRTVLRAKFEAIGIDESWHCPSCQRDAFSCCWRSPKAGQWTFGKKLLGITPAFGDGAPTERTMVCFHCGEIARYLAGDGGPSPPHITVDVVRRAIKESHPHIRHTLQADSILKLLAEPTSKESENAQT